jgi:DNA-directed RNA polymerase specialized sigma24 family protein
VDPTTGEVLPAGSVLESPDVIRALHAAVAALDRRSRAAQRDSSLPDNAGKSWGPADDADLVKMFELGRSIAEIAETFQRTRGAIESRLVRLGKLTDRRL